MFTNSSPLVYPSSMSQNSYLNMNQNHNPNQMPTNPKEMEMIMRQKWNESQSPMQSDPYTQFQNEMYQCSPTVKNKIMNDDEYKNADCQCEVLMKQALEEALIPQLINTPNGRMAFERLAVITKTLKQKYIQEEVQANEQLQELMNDEVVLNRLRELKTGQASTRSSKVSKPVQGKPEAPMATYVPSHQTIQATQSTSNVANTVRAVE